MQYFINTLTNPFGLRRPGGPSRRASGIRFTGGIRRHTYEPEHLGTREELRLNSGIRPEKQSPEAKASPLRVTPAEHSCELRITAHQGIGSSLTNTH